MPISSFNGLKEPNSAFQRSPSFLESSISLCRKLKRSLLSRSQFDNLVSGLMETKDICRKVDVGKLFRISDEETSEPLHLLFYNAVVRPAPPDNGTESSFISFWDDNIRRVLEMLVPLGRSVRGSNHNTSTLKIGPDYGFIIENVCPFRGEEKSPTSNDDPKAELSYKLAWVYQPAPYVFGEHNYLACTRASSHYPRLLCHWACRDSRCNLRSAATIKRAIGTRPGIRQLATQARSHSSASASTHQPYPLYLPTTAAHRTPWVPGVHFN